MADEITSHNQEQLEFGVSFLDDKKNTREEFLKFSSLTTITGEHVAQEIQRSLEGFSIQIQDMRGQGYGGASNMSSNRVEEPARIRNHAPRLSTAVDMSWIWLSSIHVPFLKYVTF